MKKRCAIYIRTSEIEQSRELQAAEILGYAKESGFKVVKIYEDYGVKPKEERKQLTDLMAGARMGRFDFVLTWRLDRMFHSHRHLVATLQELHPMGVGMISVRDRINTFAENGELFMHMFQVFDTFHRVVMAERAQAGINGSRAKGNFFGRLHKIDRKKLTSLMKEGHTVAEMARRLNCSVSGLYQVKRRLRLESATVNASGASL